MSYCLNPHCPAPQNPAPQNEAEACQSCGMRLGLGRSLPDGKTRRYVALKPLGSGGFGRTFVAIQQVDSGRSPCVIKQFFPQSKNPESRARAIELFQQEAEQLRQLGEHPQIPHLLDNLEQDGHLYLIQEFIDGRNLAEELEEDAIFSEQKIRQLLLELLPVLQFLHDHQVIHRDIKPANIIRPKSYAGNRPPLVLVDLGAAKQATQLDQVLTGTIIGSAEFAAPEQARGKATFASDLYSLGSTCIYLLTHISPFDLYDTGEGHWVWRDYLQKPISEELGQILDKLLEPATRRRYQTANEVLIDLGVPPEKFSNVALTSTVATVGFGSDFQDGKTPGLPDFTINPARVSTKGDLSDKKVVAEAEIVSGTAKPLDVKLADDAAMTPTSAAEATSRASTSVPTQHAPTKNKPSLWGISIAVILGMFTLLNLTRELTSQPEVARPNIETKAQVDDSIKTIQTDITFNHQIGLDEAGERLAYTLLPQFSNELPSEIHVISLSNGTLRTHPHRNFTLKKWWNPNEYQNFSFPTVEPQNNVVSVNDVFSGNAGVSYIDVAATNNLLRLSDNNQFLTAQTKDSPSEVSIFDLETRQRIGGFSASLNKLRDLSNPATDRRMFALSPDGKSVAIAQYSDVAIQTGRPARPIVTAIEIRDTQNGNLLGTLRTAPSDAVPSDYFFSPSGNFLVAIAHGEPLEVWNVKDATLVGTVPQLSARSTTKLVFSPTQEQLIILTDSDGLWVWDVTDTGLRVARTIPDVPPFSNFAISPDGYTLAWTAPSQVNPGFFSINITDLRSGTPILTLEGLPEDLTRLIFSKSGDRLVSVSASGTVKLWQIFR